MAEALQECSVLADLLDNCASPNRAPGAGRGDGNATGFSDGGDGDDSDAAGWNTLCDLWTLASAQGWCILSERIAEIFEGKFVSAARSGALARLDTTQLHRVLLHGRVSAPPSFVLEHLRDWARARLLRGHYVGDKIFGARGAEQGLRGLLDQADVARCAEVSRSVSLAVRSCGVGREACTISTAPDQVAQTGRTEQAVEAVLAPLMPPRTMLCAEWRGWLLGNHRLQVRQVSAKIHKRPLRSFITVFSLSESIAPPPLPTRSKSAPVMYNQYEHSHRSLPYRWELLPRRAALRGPMMHAANGWLVRLCVADRYVNLHSVHTAACT